MSAVVTRRETGETLLIDGVVQVRTSRPWIVTEFPVADTLTDHSQRRPETYSLDCIISETPPEAAEETGPEHVEAVVSWLKASAGQLLDVEIVDRLPIRGVLLTDASDRYGILKEIRLTLGLREVRFADTQSFQTTAASALVEPGLSGEADDGEQAPEEVDNRGLAASLVDLLSGLGD